MSGNPTQGGDGNGGNGNRVDGIGIHNNCVYGNGVNGSGFYACGANANGVSDDRVDGVNINGARGNAVDGNRIKVNGVCGIGGGGFSVTGVEPRETDHAPPPCFLLAALLPDLQPHAELDLRTLAYHLQQSDATAADGYCHAAINEARSFLEALVVNVVHAVQRDARDRGADDTVSNGASNGARNGARNSARKGARNGAQNGTAFRNYRRYLRDAGLIDAEENELLRFVYSVASAKGSHHGVTDEAWTRLARRIVFSAGQYVVQRYAAWKRGGRDIASPAEKPTPPRRRWLPPGRWLLRLVSRRKKVSGWNGTTVAHVPGVPEPIVGRPVRV